MIFYCCKASAIPESYQQWNMFTFKPVLFFRNVERSLILLKYNWFIILEKITCGNLLLGLKYFIYEFWTFIFPLITQIPHTPYNGLQHQMKTWLNALDRGRWRNTMQLGCKTFKILLLAYFIQYQIERFWSHWSK